MSILFCTSFNQELYKASGKGLMDSFDQFQKKGKLFVGYEDGWTNPSDKYIVHDLDNDYFLQGWLKANADVIPKHLGGKVDPCSCSNTPFRRPETHIKGCHFQWFNRNASRWFRKVATIHAACEWLKEDIKDKGMQRFDYLIWLDADCNFKQEITHHKLSKIFKDTYSLFYMKGPRAVPECGVFGFDLQKEGSHNFLEQYFNYYQTQRYRQYDRWDDSFIFYMVMKDQSISLKCGCRDIVPKNCKRTTHADVLKFSLLKDYFSHNKGRHGRKLNIMK